MRRPLSWLGLTLLAAGALLGDGSVTVRGVVRGLSDAELRNALVEAYPRDRPRVVARVGERGTFELRDLPPGFVSLLATSGDGSRRTGTSLELDASSGEVSVELTFKRGYTLRGRVLRNGRPVIAEVRANPLTGREGGTGGTTTTNADGEYSFEGLQAGTFLVIAQTASREASPTQRRLELSRDETLDLVFPRGRISGRVVEAGSRIPVIGARVRAAAPERARGSSSTDDQGRFLLSDLELEPYRLSVTAERHLVDSRTVTPSEAADGEVTIELVPGDGLALVARDGRSGAPLRSLQYLAVDDEGQTLAEGSPVLFAGRTTVPAPNRARYRLRVGANGYAPRELEMQAPATELALTFRSGGTLELRKGPRMRARRDVPQLRLLDANREPIFFSLWAAPGQRLPMYASLRRLEHLAPGRYTVEVDGGGGVYGVTVAEGQTAVVELP